MHVNACEIGINATQDNSCLSGCRILRSASVRNILWSNTDYDTNSAFIISNLELPIKYNTVIALNMRFHQLGEKLAFLNIKFLNTGTTVHIRSNIHLTTTNNSNSFCKNIYGNIIERD